MARTKVKIHFNRVNMQRGTPTVWTVCFKGTCHQGEEIRISIPCKTVFRPEARQPRAWFEGLALSVERSPDGRTLRVS